MRKKSEKVQSIKILLLYLIILPVTFSIFAILIVQSVIEYSRFSKEAVIIREEYKKEIKDRLKTEVEQGIAIIQTFVKEEENVSVNRQGSNAASDIELRERQNRVIKLLEHIESPDVGYLFGATWEGIAIMGVVKGQNIFNITDVHGMKVVQELIRVSKAGGGYVEYVMPEETGERSSPKISYAAPFPEWEWYIGAGVYIDKIETIIAQRLDRLNEQLLFDWIRNLIIISVILVISILIGKIFSRRLTESFSRFLEFLEKAAHRSLSINPRSLYFIELREIAEYTNKMVVARIKSENAVTESMEQFKRIIDKMPVLLDAFNKENRIIFWNKECERVTGYTAEEVIHHPDPLTLLYPDPVYRQNMLDTYEKYGFFIKSQEWEITTKQREKRIISWTNISDQFAIPGWHTWAIGIDVTENRSMENQLRQSEKLRAIGQLAGGVAHDFNNQLAAILGYTEILDAKCGEKFKDYTQGIFLSISRASDLTQNLLAFARRGKFQSVNVDINRIIEEVVDILKHSIDKRIEIKTFLHKDFTGVKGDPTQIQNAFLNIALNARDAMPEGGTVTFQTDIVELDDNYYYKTQYHISPGTYVKISISDTGVGMNDEVFSHIFEPFFTTKSSKKGTGMGLAAVYGTVKNHKGLITAESKPGKGSCFYVYLPFTPGHVNIKSQEPVVYQADKRRNILLIDDEEFVRIMARILMENLGYSVYDYDNGADALHVFRNKPGGFDLVVLDLIMPKEGGREVFKKLREIDPTVKVLLVSGYSIDGEAQSLLDLGAADFLQKPFRRAELSRKIAEILGKC